MFIKTAVNPCIWHLHTTTAFPQLLPIEPLVPICWSSMHKKDNLRRTMFLSSLIAVQPILIDISFPPAW